MYLYKPLFALRHFVANTGFTLCGEHEESFPGFAYRSIFKQEIVSFLCFKYRSGISKSSVFGRDS